MFTGSKDRKGQIELAISIAAFAAILLLVYVVFISSLSGSDMSNTIKESISFQVGEVRHNSFVTVTLKDSLWRARERFSGIEDYDGRSAYKIISYYYSTPGDTVYVGGNDISKSKVKQDLEKYLTYRADQIWSNGPNSINYKITLKHLDSDRSENIEVSSGSISDPFLQSSFSISLFNGESVRMIVQTQNSRGVHQVS